MKVEEATRYSWLVDIINHRLISRDEAENRESRLTTKVGRIHFCLSKRMDVSETRLFDAIVESDLLEENESVKDQWKRRKRGRSSSRVQWRGIVSLCDFTSELFRCVDTFFLSLSRTRS